MSVVNSAKWLIAVWDCTKGGTSNCVAYAKKHDVKIMYIEPPKELQHPYVSITVKDD